MQLIDEFLNFCSLDVFSKPIQGGMNLEHVLRYQRMFNLLKQLPKVILEIARQEMGIIVISLQ